MEGTVTEVNERHLVAAQTAAGFAVFEQLGPHFHPGDQVSWKEGLGDGYVLNRTLQKEHRVIFQCRSVESGSLHVHMRGQV